MTKLVPDRCCTLCGGILVPPLLLAASTGVPGDADYVCFDCGSSFQWRGTPPELKVLETGPDVSRRRPPDTLEDS